MVTLLITKQRKISYKCVTTPNWKLLGAFPSPVEEYRT